MKILILEDEAIIREDLVFRLKRDYSNLFTKIIACKNLKEAYNNIKEYSPDVALFDIQLPDGNSFELLKRLPKIDFQLAFITAYSHFALKAIKVGAIDYLLKPVEDEDFEILMQKIVARRANLSQQQQNLLIESLSKESLDKIALFSDDIYNIIAIKNIISIKSDGAYTEFNIKNKEKPMIVSKPLKEYVDLLSDGFIRCHRSYLVNLDYIIGYHKDNYLILSDSKMTIPVSSRKKSEVLKRLDLK